MRGHLPVSISSVIQPVDHSSIIGVYVADPISSSGARYLYTGAFQRRGEKRRKKKKDQALGTYMTGHSKGENKRKK
jgi:hypothetical protein